MAKLTGIEVFAVGTWNRQAFDAADLDAMVESFGELGLTGRLPVKLGHTTNDGDPAQGWIESVRRVGDKLLADLADVPDELVASIKAGRYRHVSVELLQDVERHGRRYAWVLDGLAVLGAARPAVGVLERLDRLVASALPGASYRERWAFTSRVSDGSEVERLRAELDKMTREMVSHEFESAITSGRVLPRDREAFYGRMGTSATLEEARAWIGATPRPAAFVQRQSSTRVAERAFHASANPDEELVGRAQELVDKSGGKLTYSQASLKVLREDRELAERYRHLPGER